MVPPTDKQEILNGYARVVSVAKHAHHFIPRFHLAQFVGYHRGRELAVFDKRWGTFRRRAVKQTAVSQDYYEVPGETLEERLAVEDEFARLEHQVAPLVRGLASLSVGTMVGLGGSARQILAEYVAILHVRVPAWRDSAMVRATDMTTDLGAMGLDDPERFLARARAHGMTGTDEALEHQRARFVDDIESGRTVVTVSNAASLMALTSAVGKVAPMLVDRCWELLRTDDWPGLVLGDQPVALFHAGRLAPSIGFGTAGVQVLVPLSPRTLLVISDRPRETMLRVFAARTPAIREPWWVFANKVAWLTSQRFVYGQTIGHLQAAESLLPVEDRRRDLRVLDSVEAATMKARDRQRREEWSRTGEL